MITLHVFTEERSAKNIFDELLPKILPENVNFRIYPHQGKHDLDKALRTTLPTISKLPGSKILITRDQDNDDCVILKNSIDLRIKDNCHCEYYIRIICKELESWFLGDLDAIKSAFPRFNPNQYFNKANLRNVDKLHSPNKYLLKIIPEYSGRKELPKIETSQKISKHLDIENNKSQSFRNTIKAIKRLTNNEEN